MTGRLDGRVALVTGSAGAIGSEIVRVLAETGATVVGADREPPADVQFDVGDADAVQRAVDGVVAEHGRIDILVNAAGIFGDMTRTDRIDPEIWDRYLKVDLSGPFYVIRAVLPHMVEPACRGCTSGRACSSRQRRPRQACAARRSPARALSLRRCRPAGGR